MQTLGDSHISFHGYPTEQCLGMLDESPGQRLAGPFSFVLGDGYGHERVHVPTDRAPSLLHVFPQNPFLLTLGQPARPQWNSVDQARQFHDVGLRQLSAAVNRTKRQLHDVAMFTFDVAFCDFVIVFPNHRTDSRWLDSERGVR